MNGGLNIGMILEDLCYSIPIGNIGLVENAVAGELHPAGDERIQNDGGMTGILQCRTDGAANVTGSSDVSTGNQNFHCYSLKPHFCIRAPIIA